MHMHIHTSPVYVQGCLACTCIHTYYTASMCCNVFSGHFNCFVFSKSRCREQPCAPTSACRLHYRMFPSLKDHTSECGTWPSVGSQPVLTPFCDVHGLARSPKDAVQDTAPLSNTLWLSTRIHGSNAQFHCDRFLDRTHHQDRQHIISKLLSRETLLSTNSPPHPTPAPSNINHKDTAVKLIRRVWDTDMWRASQFSSNVENSFCFSHKESSMPIC